MKYTLAIALFLLGLICASAQVGQMTRPGLLYPGVLGYSGPGDIVTSASGFWGLRAYNAAYATGSNKAANVCDTATLAVCTDVNILATGAFDVTTAAALTQCASSCSIKILYDQSGNGHDMAGSGTFAPVLTFNCVNTSLPCLTFLGSASQRLFKASTGGAQPNTVSFVAIRTATFTAQNTVFSANTGCETGFRSSANQAVIDAATVAGATANDSVWHAIQALCSSTSSVLNVDGTDTTSLNAGTNAAASNWSLGERTNTSLFLTGKIAEVGFWLTTGFTLTQRNNICHNQRVYWGISGTC